MDYEREGVPCMVMRGGTSKGLYFLEADLPADPHERDNLLLRLMGTPDPRQIDGLGGARTLTSKVAIVSPGAVAGQVDYLFLQLGVDEATVSDRQNCGNLLAGVGPFAVERGLVGPDDGLASVVVHLRNTGSRATATFPVHRGMPTYAGDTTISGVPGSAATVRLDFADIAGSSSGALLPTGRVADDVDGVACTLVDNGMPVVVFRADQVGATGYETLEELEAASVLRARIERIRLLAGPLMNLGDVAGATVPKMVMVAPPKDDGDLCTRSFIPHAPHDAIGVLAALSVASAALLPGSPAAAVLSGPGTPGQVTVEHPTGALTAVVDLVVGEGAPEVGRAGIVRTARKLMDGHAFPREKA